ncbi:hypothetical protein [Aquabacterium sp. A08]|uniref:hypothetical protein n=1 Tax=Aquabacterium sp. A08 TaxID=2718532 RepID=UPI0014246309|nr:hypothetical protein [Aquabacterium sp. A08]NIC43562.1 hypothetical protein [Aquabacterium sp. A08]
MTFCARYIAPGEQIGTAGATPVYAEAYLLQPAGPPPCAPGHFEVATGTSPFALTIEEAQQIGGALLMLMAVAFVLRMIRKLIEQRSDQAGDD